MRQRISLSVTAKGFRFTNLGRHHAILPEITLQWNLDITKCQGTGEIGSLYRRVRYIEVLFHTLHYYWAEKCCSLYRGLRYIEVC